MYLEQLIQYFNTKNASIAAKNTGIAAKNTEFELKLILEKSKSLLPYFINTFDKSIALSKSQLIFNNLLLCYKPKNKQTINFIDSSQSVSKIKELHFINGEQLKDKKRFYTKTQLHTTMYLCVSNSHNFKISLNDEECINMDFNEYDLIRFKQRFSFQVENWSVDFTFVKTSNTKSPQDMKEIRDKMFKNINVTSIFGDKKYIWEYADSIEIEFEYMSDTPMLLSSIKQVINLVNSCTIDYSLNTMLSEPETQINILSKISEIIQPNINTNTKNNTLKRILPNAIEINKKQYFEFILPHIRDFYLTDKADGLRIILIIDKHISSFGTELTLIETNNYFNVNETIIECELINGVFYAFDILKYDGVITTDKKFSERLQYLDMLEDEGLRWGKLIIKTFIKLENHKEQIREFVNNLTNKPYYCDGIIFTSANYIYKNTKYYKWKPPKDMTIDFIAKLCPKELLGCNPYISKLDHTLYILFNGISLKEYKKLNMVKIKYYKNMFSQCDKSYFPIQFSPSDNSIAYLYWHDNSVSDLNLDNKIIELRLVANKWKFVRLRDDRIDDYQKKSYYGNSYKVAELIWRNYSNPLTLDILCSDIKEFSQEFYFRKHNSDDHTTIRKFNNMVKYELLMHLKSSISNSTWVVDLCSGKGNDLFKYAANSDIKNVFFIDNNENNLCSIIERKYIHVNDNKDSRLGIYIKNLDLIRDSDDNYEMIHLTNPFLQKAQTKLVVCNFAIHYFTKNIASIDNFINLVDLLLGSSGRFLFTCLDGKKVFDLLKKHGSWGDGKRYLIKSDNLGKDFLGGEEIDILLPFSDGEMFKEYLVNLPLIKRRFTLKKIKQESQANFEDNYLSKFEELFPSAYNALEPIDKEYIGLLSFSIYHKK